MDIKTMVQPHQQFFAILDIIPHGIYIVNQDHDIQYLNRIFETEFGPVNGRKCYQYIHDRAEICPWCRNQEVFSGKSVRWEWYSTKNKKHYDLYDTPLTNPDGTISKLKIVIDVSPLKEAEQTLKSIFETASDGILVAEVESKKFLTANQAGCRMLGYTLDEMKNLTVTDIHPAEDLPYVLEQFAKQQRGELVVSSDLPVKRKDGSVFYADISSSPMPLGDKQYLIGIFRDITEKKRMERELLKIKKLESVGLLAGGIAHDFNNILTSILGNLNLAVTYIEPESKAHPLLREAEKASVRAKDLTQQLLTFSKGGEPVRQTASIGKIITDSADFVLRGSGVSCNFCIPEDLWQAEVDPGQLSQVIQNIILNARDAMAEGGMIELSCENIGELKKASVPLPHQRHIKITVSDTGSGIPEKYLEKIFDPYFSTKQTGSGLGLAICHSIITKHEGAIAVQSEEGKGTTFTIYLPATRQNVQTGDTPAAALAGNGRRASIMIMDDESMVREVAGQMLARLGHGVVLAENGQEAVALYQDHFDNGPPIDAVIMDLTIPGGLGGKEAVRKILRINPGAKVIVSSGYSNDPVMAHFQDYGFKASLAKPFQLAELNRIITAVLE